MNHKELEVWKKSVALVSLIYHVTDSFPDNEKFGITTQMRRAAVSIPSDIAEGAARNRDKELVHFLYISLGSVAEVETLLTISSELKFLNQTILKEIISNLEEIKKMLLGLINYLKKKHRT